MVAAEDQEFVDVPRKRRVLKLAVLTKPSGRSGSRGQPAIAVALIVQNAPEPQQPAVLGC